MSNQVDSLFPQPDKFRLTPEVLPTFTEKLKIVPQRFCGRPVPKEVVRADGRKLVFDARSGVGDGSRNRLAKSN